MVYPNPELLHADDEAGLSADDNTNAIYRYHSADHNPSPKGPCEQDSLPNMHHSCIHHASFMYTSCVIHAYIMHHSCVQCVSFMYTMCVIHVHTMHVIHVYNEGDSLPNMPIIRQGTHLHDQG